jgi:hypothetical protein
MNKDLGVWTYEDCAPVLIDYQKEMHTDALGVADAEKRAASAVLQGAM